MSTYKELLKQREDLEARIREARKTETSEAVAKVRAMISDYGLTAQDVFPAGRGRSGAGSSAKGSKVAAKYRDPATGSTWTGRGKAPRWIQGQDRSAFMIS
jgi:DNA-binding protein H-NS